MADKKLTELTEATEVDLTDQLYSVVGETSNRITVETLRNALDTLLADNNLSELGDASVARTNLGLGSAAVEDDSRYAHRANNLSDLDSAPTSRDNLGLGTAATEDDSRYVNVNDTQSVGGLKTFSDGIEADSYGGDGVTQSATDTTAGRVILTDHGWTAGNLIGTVSQSGGDPTGAVIERGSNSNGEFVRFADGTQICWHRVSGIDVTDFGSGTYSDPYRSGKVNWTYPASFSATPELTASPFISTDNPGARMLGATMRNAEVSSGGWVVWRGSSVTAEPICSLMLHATGRWF